ncbi:MAG: isopenicillin N synthase-like dioxygenase, partial [Colwellia sp.]
MQVQVIDYQASDAAEKFVESLRNTGFGVLTNHPIQQALVDKIYQDWYVFFSQEEKQGFAFDAEKQDGYFAPEISETAKGHNKKDIKEYYHVYPWGRIPAQLKTDILNYYKMASDLASELLDWVEKYSPPEVTK